MASFQVGAGLSRLPDSAEAARAATRQALAQAGCTQAQWALCFFTAAHLPRADVLRRIVLEDAGCQAFAGCSAMGVIGCGEEAEMSPAVAVLLGHTPGMETQSGVLPLDGDGLTGYAALADWQEGSQALFVLPDTFRANHEELEQRLRVSLPGIPLFGAGAVDDGSLGISLQLGMEGVRSNSMAVLGLYGAFDLAVGVTQSCSPVGEPHFITKADEHILIELDGKPALFSYIAQGQELGIETMQQASLEVLFGFPLDAQAPSFTGEACLVRHLAGFHQETQGLVIPHPMEETGTLGFMHRSADSAEKDMRRMLLGLREQLAGPPDFGVYFDCAARGRGLYGREGVDVKLIHEVLGEFPLVGMFGGFELATTLQQARVYTYTGVLTLFRARG